MTSRFILAGSLLALAACDACSAPVPAATAPHGRGKRETAQAVPGPRGRVAIEDGWVVLHAEQPAYGEACLDLPRLEKQIGTQWLPITDERPPAERNPGYYLDGSYVGPSYNEGCDVRGCTQLPAALPVAQAAEFVRTGMRNDPRGQPVVQLEKRPLTGPVRVAAKLHANARCDGAVPGIFEMPRP